MMAGMSQGSWKAIDRIMALRRPTWAGWRAPVARTLRRPAVRRPFAALGVLAVTLTGLGLGLLLFGHTTQDVGPFRARFAVSPTVSGGTELRIPPLGSLNLRSHDGPAHLTVNLEALDQTRTKALVSDPEGISRASVSAPEDINRGLTRLALQVAGVCVLGAMLLGALVFRSMRRVAACGGLALAIVVGTAGSAFATFRPNAIEEPRYEGLLTNAPAVIGDARRIADRYDEYRAELQRMIRNVSRLYGTVSSLPVYEPSSTTTRVLHISDMHLNPAAWSVVQTVVEQFGIDVVIDTGDIVDWGSGAETNYVSAIAALKVPYVYVRGNHDSAAIQAAVAAQPNAIVLDNGTTRVHGLTIAGIGDPVFTPDKDSAGGDNAPPEVNAKLLTDTGRQLAGTVRAGGRLVDIALVHDPAMAPPLVGDCPVVLAGHTHKREIRTLDNPAGSPADLERTRLMVQGSTGGAGLRGLEKSQPIPLAMSVLYFDNEQVLQAWDDISVGGTGQSEVTLERRLAKPGDTAAASPAASPPVPAPAPVSPAPVTPGPVAPALPPLSVPASPQTPAPTGQGR